MEPLSPPKGDETQDDHDGQKDKNEIALKLGMALVTGMDLRVPTLRISPRYRTSGSSTGKTTAQWEDGFYGNVVFVKWEEFDGKVNDTIAAIRKLHYMQSMAANTQLSMLRMFIYGQFYMNDKNGNRRRLNESSAAVSVNTSTNTNTGDTYTPAQGAQSRVNTPEALETFLKSFPNNAEGPEENNPEQANRAMNQTVSELFTDETSTVGVNSIVFMIALSLIRYIRDKKDLFFNTHMFSSELILNHQFGLEALRNWTSVCPDKALVTFPDSKERHVAPVCSFEFKGPGLDIDNFKHARAISVKFQDRLKKFRLSQSLSDKNPIRSGTSHETSSGNALPQGQSPHNDSMGLLTSGTTTTQDEATANMSTPRRESNNVEDDINEIQREDPAKFLAECMNTLFPSGCSSKDFENTGVRKLQRIIAQTLTQGLISQSGCSFLYTSQYGIAFEILGLNADGKVAVAVSRQFYCHEHVGAIAAIVTQADYSLNRISNEGDLLSKIRECAVLISSAAGPPRGNTNNKRDRPGGRPNAGKNGNQEPPTKRSKTTGNSSTGMKETTDSCIQQNAGLDDVSFATAITVSEGDQVEGIQFRESTENALADVFSTRLRVVGVGSSGLVLLGSWKGRSAAVKSWNREADEGLEDLCREIGIYRLIQSGCPQLLGFAVPDLFYASRNHGIAHVLENALEQNTFLVTEFVGRSLERDEDGTLFLGDRHDHEKIEKLSIPDETGISKAALQSLSALHEKGFLHGDVSLRNLRVERPGNHSSSSTWLAWWIDLGKATKLDSDTCNVSSLFELEIDECMSLFGHEDTE